MRWRNTETPTFAGAGGNKPAIVEAMELLDHDDNVVATFAKDVAGAKSFDVDGSDSNVDITSGTIELAPEDSSSGSFQPIAVDLNLTAGAGRDESCYKAPIMGNIIGDTMTKLGNILGGLIGKYSILGANASTYPKAGVIAEIGDGVEDADGAFVAVLGGDSEVTTARAAFTVDNQNSTPNSKFTYGLDLRGVDHDSYGLVEIDHAIRFPDGTTQDSAASGGGLSAPETPAETPDDVEDTFTFSAAPKMIFRNGVMEYRLGTVAGVTFVFDTPPQTGDDIEGYV